MEDRFLIQANEQGAVILPNPDYVPPQHALDAIGAQMQLNKVIIALNRIEKFLGLPITQFNE